MKRFKLIECTLLALLLAGCSDEIERSFEMPESGEEIAFGTQLQNFSFPQTKTIYGVPEGSTVQNYNELTIDWVEGDDVRVYSPQASTECQWADYDVKSMSVDGNTEYYLAKQGDIGVRWGETEQTHEFYAFYPVNIGRGERPSTISGLNGNTTVTATIPVAQEHGELVEAGNTETNVGNVTLPAGWKLIRPDMTYAMMAGRGTWDPAVATEKNVTLNFTPLVSVMDVVINGPAEGEPAMSIYTVSVRSKTQPIVGEFTYDVATQTFSGMDTEVTNDNNIATINCMQEENGVSTPITLAPGEVLTLKFFLLPRDIAADELSVSVLTDAGRVLTQSLSTDASASGTTLAQGKITRVVTPKMSVPATSNWMSLIDDNVLFTQLSLPGSKHSYTGDLYSTESANIDAETIWMSFYQSLYVADGQDTQFDRGIRAFDLKLYLQRSGWNGYNAYVYSGNSILVNDNYENGMTIENVLTNLYSKIQATVPEGGGLPTECAVVCLNYVEDLNVYSMEEWLNTVVNALTGWNRSRNALIQINPSTTTMGTMRGKIAVIINMPEGMSTPSSSNLNYISTFGSGMQNTTLQTMTLNGSSTVRMQNLYQVNNPAITTGSDQGWGIYGSDGLVPYYATVPEFSLGHDLLDVKADLMNELFTEAKKNANQLYINDLSGFCVVKHGQSTGFQQAVVRTYQGIWYPNRITNDGNFESYYDYNNLPTNTDYRGNDEPRASWGETWLDMGEDQSWWGQGGNTAEFAEKFNPVALNAVYNMVNTGRVPLGLVFMNFAGVDQVRAGNDNRTYQVYGERLPGLVMANNFMFPLETAGNN